MSRRKWKLNSIYISERLQESLRPISGCALTTVVAPMGYGKTTSVNWYLSERAKNSGTGIIRISVYSDNLAIFWKSVQDAFTHAGFDFLQEYPFPADPAGGSILADDLCHELEGEKPVYCFIDDFHLMTDHRVSDYICVLANRLPENVHMIIASRDRFLPAAGILRLGKSVYQVGVDELRLNHTELSIYSRKLGLELSEEEIGRLVYSSEGWFSAVYLNLRNLFEHGALPDGSSDIYSMFSAALIDPLPGKQREFIAVMGLADEFTLKMAEYVTGNPDAGSEIRAMTEQNAFVTRLPDGETFRFHHMMKECAERAFKTLDIALQNEYRNRYGAWYEENGRYIHAMREYRQSGNYDALLEVVKKDAGILLASIKPSVVLSSLSECPEGILMEHPLAVLVLMRCMFNWHEIPKMMELKGLFLRSMEEHPDMDSVEKGNLYGEYDLIMSFLQYNDISAMSRLHRSASSRMTGKAVSIRKSGGWTFGSPSVLMMFHRESGEVEKELREMDDCMPHYYKITDGHGKGAEKIMRAEALLMQGRFQDAEIELEAAYDEVEGNSQDNMALCCDFTALRLSLFTGGGARISLDKRYKELINKHNITQINIWRGISAYYHALLGENEKIPEVYASHGLSSVNILAPGKPMHDMIENQVYLSQGSYARVIGRRNGILGMCSGLHYALVALHVNIQTAAAYEMMDRHSEASEILKEAVAGAEKDGFIIPFAENYRFIGKILGDLKGNDAFLHRIKQAGELCESLRREKSIPSGRPEAFKDLTEREYEIVLLKRNRLSNREIAGKLFISEGTVKQYINQIYGKLSIEGDTKTKRRRLQELLTNN